MTVKPEEAKNYECCAQNRLCAGERCMAWKWVEQKEPKSKEPVAPVKMGYCGLTQK